MRRIAVAEFLQESKNGLILDVRSPGEYKHAHIPGAVSLPLFSDEERAVVGTEYKQVGRQAAIKIGLDYFGPRMKEMVEEVERLVDYRADKQRERIANVEKRTRNVEVDRADISRGSVTNPKLQTPNARLFVYCWRGGMRSGAVSWLLNLYGFNVTTLAGGYKAFRNHVLQSFGKPYHFKILGGYTGSGKTELLQRLKESGEKVVCLESLASHKGSAFGNLNMPPQPSQEMFENILSCELLAMSHEQEEQNPEHPNTQPQNPNSIWLEDESQRIGTINLPNALWQTMRTSPVYFLEIPFEERLKHITEEYSRCGKERLAGAIERIKKRLGGVETKNALQALADEDYTGCFRILLKYYDKFYLKGLHNRPALGELLTNIPCQSVSEQNAALLSQTQFVS